MPDIDDLELYVLAYRYDLDDTVRRLESTVLERFNTFCELHLSSLVDCPGGIAQAARLATRLYDKTKETKEKAERLEGQVKSLELFVTQLNNEKAYNLKCNKETYDKINKILDPLQIVPVGTQMVHFRLWITIDK